MRNIRKTGMDFVQGNEYRCNKSFGIQLYNVWYKENPELFFWYAVKDFEKFKSDCTETECWIEFREDEIVYLEDIADADVYLVIKNLKGRHQNYDTIILSKYYFVDHFEMLK